MTDTIDQLAMANSVHWYDHLLRREDGDVLRRALDRLSLTDTIDQLAMANSVHWYDHLLRREDGDVLRRALDVEFD